MERRGWGVRVRRPEGRSAGAAGKVWLDNVESEVEEGDEMRGMGCERRRIGAGDGGHELSFTGSA